MKKIFLLIFLAGFLFACDSTSETTTENTDTEEVANGDEVTNEEAAAEENVEEFPEPDAVGNFGAEITADGAVEGEEVLAQLASMDSARIKVRGTISSCCQAKGCWMTMPLNDEAEMMIKFKDYAFFAPMNSSGKSAVVEGWAYREVVSVEELQHLAADNEATEEEINAITEPEERITFMADGLIVEGEAESAE